MKWDNRQSPTESLYSYLGSRRKELMGFSHEPTSVKDLDQASMQRLHDLEYKSQAAGLKQRWLSSLSGSWDSITGERRKSLMDALEGVMGKKALSALRSNPDAGKGILERESSLAGQSRDQYSSSASRLNATEIARLNATPNRTQGQEEELQSRLNANAGTIERIADDVGDWESKERKISEALAVQKGMFADIDKSLRGFGLDSANEDLLSLTRQARVLREILKSPGLDEDLADTLSKQARTVESDLAYRQSIPAQRFAAFDRNKAVTLRFTRTEGESKAVGENEVAALRGVHAAAAAEADDGVGLQNLNHSQTFLLRQALHHGIEQMQFIVRAQQTAQVNEVDGMVQIIGLRNLAAKIITQIDAFAGRIEQKKFFL
jgi:hypothetical protein